MDVDWVRTDQRQPYDGECCWIFLKQLKVVSKGEYTESNSFWSDQYGFLSVSSVSHWASREPDVYPDPPVEYL